MCQRELCNLVAIESIDVRHPDSRRTIVVKSQVILANTRSILFLVNGNGRQECGDFL